MEANKISTPTSQNVGNDWLTLTEDLFGKYVDENGKQHNIKRFTWNNKNKIQVQVINYGARIISMKVPDRKGDIADIILGFDDLAGYIYYHKYYFGATIGRTSNIIPNGTVTINKEDYKLTTNYRKNHHKNGGQMGLDQVVWKPIKIGKKVIMSHVSSDMTEGYPGDLLIRITFELSERNEFKIEMEAFTTKPTIINITNFTYFNLAGHFRGSDEIYKHVVTLNCNCFTPQVDELPTGEIQNVANTPYDFQIPQTMGKLIGILPKDGYNQNLCVNKGVNQEDCFVGRVLHPPSGRMIEIYSNQRGIQFSTANEFGYGLVRSMDDLLQPEEKKSKGENEENNNKQKSEESPNINELNYRSSKDVETLMDENYLKLIEEIHKQLSEDLKIDNSTSYTEIIKLINNMKKRKFSQLSTPNNTPAEIDEKRLSNTPVWDLFITSHQQRYLKGMLDFINNKENQEDYEWLLETVNKILMFSVVDDDIEKPEYLILNLQEAQKTSIPLKKQRPSKLNIIPKHYKKSNQIIGKAKSIYRMHSGIAIQTQNYPGCTNLKNFPNCTLMPGETYKHTITYKFWIRSGNPNKWMKRNLNEIAQKKLNGVDLNKNT